MDKIPMTQTPPVTPPNQPAVAVSLPPIVTPANAPLPGFKELLVGDSGAGKTHSIRSFLGTGIQPLLLATEPGFRTLAPCDNPACGICGPFGSDNRKAPPIPWVYIPPMKPDAAGQTGSLDILMEQAKNTMEKDQQGLTKIYDTKRKDDFSQYMEVLKVLKNFVDSTGKSWGGVHTWNTDRVLVLDGLSSLGQMAMDMFAGRRPLYDKPDYQIAQRAIGNLMVYLTMQIRCPVVVIAHIGRGEDSLEGKNKITVNTVGQKLAPDLPRMFDDMIHAERDATTFKWSTATSGAVAKGRNIPISDKLVPGFGQVVTSWKKAGGVIVPTTA